MNRVVTRPADRNGFGQDVLNANRARYPKASTRVKVCVRRRGLWMNSKRSVVQASVQKHYMFNYI